MVNPQRVTAPISALQVADKKALISALILP
jgi:hypothetical protein